MKEVKLPNKKSLKLSETNNSSSYYKESYKERYRSLYRNRSNRFR